MNLIASVSLLVLLIGLSHGQTTVSPCTIEFNADYLYNDIRNEYVASTGACQDLCYAYPTCQSWSYVVVTNACWLKSGNRANRVDSQGRISGGKCPTSSGATTTASGLTPPLTTTAAISPPTTTIGQSTTTKPSTTTAGITPPTTGATTTTATTTATTATTSKATTTTATSTPTTTATSTTTTTATSTTTTATTASTATTTSASTTAASTTSASTTSSSKKCFLEVSIAYKIATLGSSSATSKDDCCAQCIAKTNCKAWTFYSDTNLCVFLDYVPMYASQREKNDKAISGVIQ